MKPKNKCICCKITNILDDCMKHVSRDSMFAFKHNYTKFFDVMNRPDDDVERTKMIAQIKACPRGCGTNLLQWMEDTTVKIVILKMKPKRKVGML